MLQTVGYPVGMDIQQLRDALTQSDSSVRLKAVLAAGTHPDDAALDVLVAQCSHEPDFYVRDMLTWAITRLPRDITIPAVRAELTSPIPQARSQALHTLSKIRVSEAWPWIFPHMLRDDDDEVVRVAWRLAVAIVPEGAEPELADVLVSQFDMGKPGSENQPGPGTRQPCRLVYPGPGPGGCGNPVRRPGGSNPRHGNPGNHP